MVSSGQNTMNKTFFYPNIWKGYLAAHKSFIYVLSFRISAFDIQLLNTRETLEVK